MAALAADHPLRVRRGARAMARMPLLDALLRMSVGQRARGEEAGKRA
jgi:hypothetical protein